MTERSKKTLVFGLYFALWFMVLSCSAAPPFFLVAAPLKWSSQKRVLFFSRVTEQLRVPKEMLGVDQTIFCSHPHGPRLCKPTFVFSPYSERCSRLNKAVRGWQNRIPAEMSSCFGLSDFGLTRNIGWPYSTTEVHKG